MDWLNQNAAAVQALAGLGTLASTVVLVAITAWYAKSARDQTKELQAARSAAIEPYIRINAILLQGVIDTPGSEGESHKRAAIIHFQVANMGPGPAMDIRPTLDLGGNIHFEVTQSSPNLESHERADFILRVTDAHCDAFTAHLPYSTSVSLWYRDLLDRLWITTRDVQFVWSGLGRPVQLAAVVSTPETRALISGSRHRFASGIGNGLATLRRAHRRTALGAREHVSE